MKFNKKARTIVVIAFILIYVLATYITLRGQYLEYAELGSQYLETFISQVKCKYIIMETSFIIISIIMLLTNIGIKKGLKPFFEQEKKEMPKLPNKSLILIFSAIASVILSNSLLDKVLLLTSNVSFQRTDIIFNMDISYYMFIKPLIEEIVKDFNSKGYIMGIENVEDLRQAIIKSKDFEPKKYQPNNQKMLEILENFIENI